MSPWEALFLESQGIFDYFHFHQKPDYDTSGYKQASEKNHEDGGSVQRDLDTWE